MITFKCFYCDKEHHAPDELAGLTIKSTCGCTELLKVPGEVIPVASLPMATLVVDHPLAGESQISGELQIDQDPQLRLFHPPECLLKGAHDEPPAEQDPQVRLVRAQQNLNQALIRLNDATARLTKSMETFQNQTLLNQGVVRPPSLLYMIGVVGIMKSLFK